MAALTTEQLECMLNCVVDNSSRALGVFPANCIPIRCEASRRTCIRSNLATATERHPQLDENHNYCFVLNTDLNDSPGEHWLAFFFSGTTHKLEYFDSFGFPISMYPHVHAALDSCGLTQICVRVNTLGMLHATTSTVCGHYCVAFLYWRAKQHPNAPIDCFARMTMSTHHDAEQRDRRVVQLLHTITSKHPCCATQLAALGNTGSCVSRFSQTCCCRKR